MCYLFMDYKIENEVFVRSFYNDERYCSKTIPIYGAVSFAGMENMNSELLS